MDGHPPFSEVLRRPSELSCVIGRIRIELNGPCASTMERLYENRSGAVAAGAGTRRTFTRKSLGWRPDRSHDHANLTMCTKQRSSISAAQLSRGAGPSSVSAVVPSAAPHGPTWRTFFLSTLAAACRYGWRNRKREVAPWSDGSL